MRPRLSVILFPCLAFVGGTPPGGTCISTDRPLFTYVLVDDLPPLANSPDEMATCSTTSQLKHHWTEIASSNGALRDIFRAQTTFFLRLTLLARDHFGLVAGACKPRQYRMWLDAAASWRRLIMKAARELASDRPRDPSG